MRENYDDCCQGIMTKMQNQGLGCTTTPEKEDIVCWTIGNIGQLSMGSPADEDIFRSHPAPISSHHYHGKRHHLLLPLLLLAPLLPLLLLLLRFPSQSARVGLISQRSYNISSIILVIYHDHMSIYHISYGHL